jgi:hypothetical protein
MSGDVHEDWIISDSSVNGNCHVGVPLAGDTLIVREYLTLAPVRVTT